MRFNTHNRTPRPKTGKLTKTLLTVCFILYLSLFALAAFACIRETHNIIAGLFIISIPMLLFAIVLIMSLDIKRAYVEIIGNNIVVVDYYFGIRKEKHYTFQEIESVEIGFGYLPKGFCVRVHMQYLVFRGYKNKYLFKVAYFPETKEFFEKHFKSTAFKLQF